MLLAFRKKLPLIILVAVCATPVIGPYLLWFFWQPSQYSNYGELVEPRTLPAVQLELLPQAAAASQETARPVSDGAATATAATPSALPSAPGMTLRGKWFLLMADGASCDEGCERKLYHLRWLRTMQGKEMERVERVWLIDDRSEPAARLREPYSGTWIVRQPDPALLQTLPLNVSGSPRNYIYLVDPLGNLMMRYPPDADPARIRKDITRLLKYSRIG